MTVKKILERYDAQPWWVQWVLTGLLSVALFAPLLGNSFVNDDFIVLKKVYLEKRLNLDGFFRPLPDLFLMLNGWLGKLDPLGYYLLRILLHATNTLQLYYFCRQWKWTSDPDRQLLFAGLAALLFLTYPFHSEPLTWTLGIGSLSGNTFGFMALVILSANWKEPAKIAGVGVCYFIGTAGYESVLVLPGIVFIWLLANRSNTKRIITWMIALAAILTVHMIIRKSAAGTLTGSYAESFLHTDLAEIVGRSAKVFGRLFLPPMASNKLALVLFAVVCFALLVIVFLLYRKLRNDRPTLTYFLAQAGMLIVALLVPFLFGLSTHTSEGDRLLYFPSFFFCSLFSFLLVAFLYGKRLLPGLILIILVYNIFFLHKTLQNWRKASVAVDKILSIVKEQGSKGALYIVNMPEEIDGAYVFRSGFQEALLINQLDSQDVKVMNGVSRDQLLELPGEIIQPVQTGQGLFIPPAVHLSHKNAFIGDHDSLLVITPMPDTRVVYWNKKEWITVDPLPGKE